MNEFPFMSGGFGKKRIEIKEYEPLKDASEHTLVLRIQMKDVTKPPMWREVEVPADFDFMQLHEVIQEVVGLENYHMWQFNAKAYDNSLQISADMENDSPFGGGMDGMTHDAEETYLTQFLQNKGDKLEYVYDFGDDWIFTVEVKELCDKKIDHPVCRKYKSELNALEDFGGIWSYLDARQDLDTWEKMSKKERKKRFQERGFDSEEEYLEFLNEHRFNLDEINAALDVY
ncbi:MAG: plasmid pRiA4b ORF-3 family protein [Muribaculaceae bacterium]|nr:plasmid pRiA4b ORF-3 family protein [Muribaculaceae bacterium]